MDNVDNYITGHEDEVEQFDYENFRKELNEWHNTIKEDLKKDRYDMNLLCVNEVLNSVQDLIYDNTFYTNLEEQMLKF